MFLDTEYIDVLKFHQCRKSGHDYCLYACSSLREALCCVLEQKTVPRKYYCKFLRFWEGFIFAKLCDFAKFRETKTLPKW